MTMSSRPTFQAIGECMVEVVRQPGGAARIGYSGDTYNTAVYLGRVAADLGADIEPHFLSGIGDDEESNAMLARWRNEGVEADVIIVPGAAPGLYLINTDHVGERSFSYWRQESAAAGVFAGTEWVERVGGSIVYLSGISLQLMTDVSRQALIRRLVQLRSRGTRVAFDSNFRATGWDSTEQARSAMDKVLAVADIALVTLDDEIALGNCADAASCAARLIALGVTDVVVKDGANGAWVSEAGQLVQVPTERVEPVDTTAAGDSFNGAYLAARVAGELPTAAARMANAVAGQVVLQAGAIVSASTMPALRS